MRNDALSDEYLRYQTHFYQVLLAEIAGFSENYRLSAYHLFTTAEARQNPELADKATHLALYAEEYELALNAAQLWLKLAPESGQARQALIASLIRSGDP